MFNRRAVAAEHYRYEAMGYSGMPKSTRMRKLVVNALQHFEIGDHTGEVPKKVTPEQAVQYVKACGEVRGRIERLGAQRAAEDEIATYLERVVLPEYPDPYLFKLAETMKMCHAGGMYGWSCQHDKNVIHWDAKCQCLQLCPHEANEETQRTTERLVPRMLELYTEGYSFMKGTLTVKNISRGEPVKDLTRKEILKEIKAEHVALLASWSQACAHAFSFGGPMPRAPALPKINPIARMQNKLHKEQQRQFAKLDQLIKMRWPRKITDRLKLLKLDDDECNRKRVSEYKGRVFPTIAAHHAVMEAPLSYEGTWHPHLNVMLVLTKNWLDWNLFESLWGGICRWSTMDMMYEVTRSRLRAKGEDVSDLTFEDVLATAFQEIIKYPVQTVAAKAKDNTGHWTGGELGIGLYVTDNGKNIAPPLTEWPADAFVEWWYAQYGFRRSRSYGGGILYAVAQDEPVQVDPLSIVWLGRIERDGRASYRVLAPLLQIGSLDLIEGHNSPLSGFNTTGLSRPGTDPPALKTWLTDQDALNGYMREVQADGYDPATGGFF